MNAVADLNRLLASCEVCPRRCRVNRLNGEKGYCGVGAEPLVSSSGPHFGEEPVLVGAGGSGTIFFTGCNLGCVFCQNYDISHQRYGCSVTARDLADVMLRLQEIGCHNINWVTPTHQIVAIMPALEIARAGGLTLPTVYNCGGYECVEVLRLIEGQVDIYMPDAKYARAETAERYSEASDYPKVMKAALLEMHRQVGDLEIRGAIATRGLLVRHLVMPGHTDESVEILDFIAQQVSPNTYVNIMGQYRPTFRAAEFPEIRRRVTTDEYLTVVHHARRLGLRISD